MTEVQPWHRQPWEGDAQFDAFQLYRDMPKPRSTDGAYRIYLARKHGLQPSDEAVAKKRAPGGWQNWSRGRNWTGTAIPGALHWEDRAATYDTHLDREAQAELEREIVGQRLQLVRDEMYDYAQQLAKFRRVWKRIEPVQDGDNAAEADPKQLLQLMDWRMLISTFGRRALNMPDRVTQSQLTGADGGKIAVELDVLHVDDLADVFRQIAEWEKEQGT